MKRGGIMMTLNKPFTLYIELPDRQLGCECVVKESAEGPTLMIKHVFDAFTSEPIRDESELPALQTIMDAATLHDWAVDNLQIFTEARTC